MKNLISENKEFWKVKKDGIRNENEEFEIGKSRI
jgi:hypothetical protein